MLLHHFVLICKPKIKCNRILCRFLAPPLGTILKQGIALVLLIYHLYTCTVLCMSVTYCAMQEGRTPLMAAVQENGTAVVQILINEGKCDRNATNAVCALDAATNFACIVCVCMFI